MDEHSLEDLEPKGEQLQQLQKDLTSLARGHVRIPSQVDQAVLQRATKALARPRRTLRTVGKPVAWIAAAASVALVVWIGALFRSTTIVPQQTTVATTPSDLDHNGPTTPQSPDATVSVSPSRRRSDTGQWFEIESAYSAGNASMASRRTPHEPATNSVMVTLWSDDDGHSPWTGAPGPFARRYC